MASRAMAVALYTLLELTRRRLLLVFVAIGLVLTAGIGIAPLVIPSIPTGDGRTLFVLNALDGPVQVAMELCALAIGATVINHDLDSGAIIAIFAKPLSRLSYASGKFVSGAVVVVFLGLIFAVGSMLVVATNGGGHTGVLALYFAAIAGNAVVVMLLVMILTVYLNNIISAVIVVFFTDVITVLHQLHSQVQNHQVINAFWDSVINTFYWVFPPHLVSNLQLDIVQTQLRLHPPVTPTAGQSLLGSVSAASSYWEIALWFAYLVVICVILYLAVRRKQV